MPTGAGKSLCYQLAAMLRPTPTLIVSPLIALMKDQVDSLPSEISAVTSLINSSLDQSAVSQRLQALVAGRYKLLYVAPERLRQKNFMSALRHVNIGLVVIDEVHCVSMWGHDFRPDYLFIRNALDALHQPSVLGLTATATPITEEDIATSLGRDLDVVRASVERPNLRYEVEFVENEEDRLRSCVSRARAMTGSGIIYARARDKCEHVAQVLRRNRVDAVHYHAGMTASERTDIQDRFLSGRARVVVATTAFGMGIDKPDIRWVLLYNFPQSLESYVQMVGRAGRDGNESVCTLLASGADASSLLRFAKGDLPSLTQLRQIYRAVRQRSVDGVAEVSAEELSALPGMTENQDPRVLIGMLERSELLRRDHDLGRSMSIEVLPPPADAASRIETLLKLYEKQSLDRARRMIAFADAELCRHFQVAKHFGEGMSTSCGMCDVCAPRDEGRGSGAPSRELPAQIAPAVLKSVERLPYPVGIKGLVATLRGTVDAPRTAQESDAFGILSAASSGKIRRWVDALIESGNLELFEKDDFRLLRVARRDSPPSLSGLEVGPSRSSNERKALLRNTVSTHKIRHQIELTVADEKVFERLRSWRTSLARKQDLPAYTILSDRTLRAVAAAKPRTRAELGTLDGMGPAKLERYADALLELLSS
jgi:ATP-dependent DNA helicase RecQ